MCHTSVPFHQTISLCYDPHTTATFPADGSDTVAGYLRVKMQTILAMISIYLYLQSSDYRSSGQAVLLYWRLQMRQLTLQYEKPTKDKECQLMKLQSVGIWRPRFLFKDTYCSFGNHRNVSGWRQCSLFGPIYIYIYIKLSTQLKTSLSKCSNLLCRKSSYFRLLILSNMLRIISLILFPASLLTGAITESSPSFP